MDSEQSSLPRQHPPLYRHLRQLPRQGELLSDFLRHKVW